MLISFVVPTTPIAQPRQRHRSFISKQGKLCTQNYTPQDHPVNAFKTHCQIALREQYQGTPLEGPISLSLVFILPRPQSLCRKKDPTGRIWHIGKPDTDNLAKAFKDALKSMAWRDDSQVCRLVATKCYAAIDETPAVEATIETL